MAHKLRPRIPSVLVLEENLVVLDPLRDNLGEKLYRHFEALPRIHFDMCFMCLVLSHMRGPISILQMGELRLREVKSLDSSQTSGAEVTSEPSQSGFHSTCSSNSAKIQLSSPLSLSLK